MAENTIAQSHGLCSVYKDGHLLFTTNDVQLAMSIQNKHRAGGTSALLSAVNTAKDPFVDPLTDVIERGALVYTAEPSGTMWVVMKDGNLFMVTHSKSSAEHIVASMNSATTPTPLAYHTSQIFDDRSDRDTVSP